jgi:hypothetical protein
MVRLRRSKRFTLVPAPLTMTMHGERHAPSSTMLGERHAPSSTMHGERRRRALGGEQCVRAYVIFANLFAAEEADS